MTFDEWADQYELDLDTRATCQSAWGEATLAEREACARLREELAAKVFHPTQMITDRCVAAIRMRSNAEVKGAPTTDATTGENA